MRCGGLGKGTTSSRALRRLIFDRALALGFLAKAVDKR